MKCACSDCSNEANVWIELDAYSRKERKVIKVKKFVCRDCAEEMFIADAAKYSEPPKEQL